MKSDAGGRRRRGLLFTVTPVVAAVLVLVGVVAVIVHNDKHTAAASQAARTTTREPAITTTTPPPTTTTTPPPTTTPTADIDHAAMRTAVGAVDGLMYKGVTFGVAIEDHDDGYVIGGANGATPFYSASVVKLFTVTYLLHQQEIGALTLSQGMMNLIPRALELSDDNAEDAFWSTYGGASLIQKFTDLFGLQNTIAPSDTSQWGETKFSPDDVLRVYDFALNKLSPNDSALVIGDLSQAADVGADGFNQAFGLLDPPRETGVKAKQGWMEIIGDSLTLNTTGVLGANNNFLVAIMTKQPVYIGWATGKQHVNTAAQVVEKELASAPG